MARNAIWVRWHLKQRAVEHMGGRCVLCGYCKCFRAMEFHHRDRASKESSISVLIAAETRKGPFTDAIIENIWWQVVDELKKCVLLCSNCHREVEAGVSEVVWQGSEKSCGVWTTVPKNIGGSC
jgi:hypothetical protein